MRIRSLVLCTLVLVGLIAAPAESGDREASSVIRSINGLRWEANTARTEAGLRPHKGDTSYRQLENVDALVRIETLWARRAVAARRLDPHPSSVWVALAECEAGGNWAYNQGTYDGGLQFHPRTWRNYKLAGYPRYAWKATPMQQILVGYKILADQGWDAWPECSKRLGLR